MSVSAVPITGHMAEGTRELRGGNSFKSLNKVRFVAQIVTKHNGQEIWKLSVQNYVHDRPIQGVPGAMCQTSGGCSLC